MSYYNEETCETCSSCSDQSNGKGYCSYYRIYVSLGDTCRYYSDGGGSSGGCFLTTVCCNYKKLPDDCYELETMRQFRDEYMKKTDLGNKLVEFYYDRAPKIVRSIENSSDREKICEYIYNEIHKCIELQKLGNNDQAMLSYGLMMYKVDLLCAGAMKLSDII